MIRVRNFEPKDVEVTWDLKFNTIRKVNIRDYEAVQTKAWAPDNVDLKRWQKRITDMNPFVAEIDGLVVGFADLQEDGYIDHFFCHSEYQGQGVGRALMEQVLRTGRLNGVSRLYSQVSLTARKFYEHFGFVVIEKQQVEINGVELTNFIMERTC
jgi:putative acetyltransferase